MATVDIRTLERLEEQHPENIIDGDVEPLAEWDRDNPKFGEVTIRLVKADGDYYKVELRPDGPKAFPTSPSPGLKIPMDHRPIDL